MISLYKISFILHGSNFSAVVDAKGPPHSPTNQRFFCDPSLCAEGTLDQVIHVSLPVLQSELVSLKCCWGH